MNLIGAFINPMGERVATALSAGVLNSADSTNSYYPVTGALLASGGVDDGKFLTTSGGDHLSYAQD